MTVVHPKLLLIVNQWAFFQSHRLPLALAAHSAGYEVHVATAPDVNAIGFINLGITHHSIPLQRGGMNPLADMRLLWALIKLLRQLKPDLVHLVTVKPAVYGGLAARCVGVRGVVMAISGLGFVFTRSPSPLQFFVKQLYRSAIRLPRLRVIFQNGDDKEVFCRFSGLREEQAVMIAGSGVDVDKLVPLAELSGPVVFTMASRLLKDKGVGEFIAAARLLLSEGLAVHFLLAGEVDPDNPASFRSEDVDSWKGLEGIEVLGHCADIGDLFARSHVVVLPSYREGMPKVLLEAAACGRAVVTTDVPGCRDAIEPGVTGLLVNVGDVLGLADAMRVLVLDGSMRRAMGKAGRLKAEYEFDIAKVISQHLQLYNAALA